MISKPVIFQSIDRYLSSFSCERKYIADLKDLVQNVADPTSRKEFQGHITCSGLIITLNSNVVLIKHDILDKWLLPGGHVEPTDNSLRGAAMREIEEEVGLDASNLTEILLADSDCPIEINRHTIPASPRKNEPEHEHWDFRFPFRLSRELTMRATEEVAGAEEVGFDQLSKDLRDRISNLIIRG